MAEIVEELLAGNKTALLLALQRATAATSIPEFFVQRAVIQLADPNHYGENGTHLLFQRTTNAQDFNELYHAALLVAEPHETEGAIFNFLATRSTGAKASDEYVRQYIESLHQVDPRNIEQFAENIKDIRNKTGWRSDFIGTTSQLASLYYNLDCDLMPNKYVQTIRWLRIILLPYLVITPGDIGVIREWIRNRLSIPNPSSPQFVMVLQLAVTRDNLLLKDLLRQVSPKVFMEIDDSEFELSDTAYDQKPGDDLANLLLFNAAKLQIAILFKKLKPNMRIRLEWNTLLKSNYYSPDTRYILRPNETDLKYRASVETISLSSNSSLLIEGFIATGMKLGFQDRRLTVSGQTLGKFDTTVPEHKAYVSSLIP